MLATPAFPLIVLNLLAICLVLSSVSFAQLHNMGVIFTQSYSMPNAMLPSVDQLSSCRTKTRYSRTQIKSPKYFKSLLYTYFFFSF